MKFINGGPRVVALNRTPTRLPITTTLAFWLTLDKLQAPGWVWGALGVIAAIWWGCTIAFMLWESHADPFDPREQQKGP